MTAWFIGLFIFAFLTTPKDVTLVEGDYYALKAVASRPSLYQWYKDGQVLPGATNSEFRIFYMLEGDQGRYHATAKYGAKVITTKPALISYQPLIRVSITNGMISLTPTRPRDQIRYTLNGNEPTSTSQLYTRPFNVANDCTLRAAVGNVEMDSVKIKAQKEERVWKR